MPDATWNRIPVLEVLCRVRGLHCRRDVDADRLEGFCRVWCHLYEVREGLLREVLGFFRAPSWVEAKPLHVLREGLFSVCLGDGVGFLEGHVCEGGEFVRVPAVHTVLLSDCVSHCCLAELFLYEELYLLRCDIRGLRVAVDDLEAHGIAVHEGREVDRACQAAALEEVVREGHRVSAPLGQWDH